MTDNGKGGILSVEQHGGETVGDRAVIAQDGLRTCDRQRAQVMKSFVSYSF